MPSSRFRRRQTHPWPIVMIHGGSQSGTNFTGTPDGREGWAQFFLRRGYPVYVVDQPGRGRAAYETDRYGPTAPLNLETTQRQFVAPERYNRWPQARLHTQWPGKGVPGDPVFDQFYASQMPSMQDFTLQQSLNRDAIVALLEKIGPSILLTHSQSGAFGWPVADARPDLVKAIVAVEPNGPPFFNVENVPAPEWFRDVPPPDAALGRHRRSARVFTGCREALGSRHRATRQARWPRPRSMLDAKRAGAAASESPEAANRDSDGGSLLSCARTTIAP